MGYLFENMEKMDIQAERRNTERKRSRGYGKRKRAIRKMTERKGAGGCRNSEIKKNLKRMHVTGK